MRREICSNLGIIGAKLDNGKNQAVDGKEMDISAKGSKVKLLVIATNEELMIAREAAAVVKGI
jgi:acetate kinase